MKNRRTTGRWYAAATVAIALTGIAALAILVLMPLRNRVLELNRRIICGGNLKAIAINSKVYAQDLPTDAAPSVAWLIHRGHLSAGQTICPSSGVSTSNYILVSIDRTATHSPSIVVAYEPKSNHGGIGGNVVFIDGHATFVTGREYDRLLG